MTIDCSTASSTSPTGRGHERPRLHQCLRTATGAYLAFKEKVGFYGTSRIWYLKQFDAYCTAHERTVFDRDTVEGWGQPAADPLRAVPVLDVLHPRRRPMAAGPRAA
jgi:hypothetical protein